MRRTSLVDFGDMHPEAAFQAVCSALARVTSLSAAGPGTTTEGMAGTGGAPRCFRRLPSGLSRLAHLKKDDAR